jgi:hypothetical protein
MAGVQRASPIPDEAAGWQAAIDAAARTPPPVGGLADPTRRPGEPITAGIAMGPGAGPEALPGFRPSSAQVFRQLADATGDTQFAGLAVLADEMGL